METESWQMGEIKVHNYPWSLKQLRVSLILNCKLFQKVIKIRYFDYSSEWDMGKEIRKCCCLFTFSILHHVKCQEKRVWDCLEYPKTSAGMTKI